MGQEIADCLVTRFGGSLGAAFSALDSNCDGFISLDELVNGFARVGLDDVPPSQLHDLFAEMDPESRGLVGVRAFMCCLRSLECRASASLNVESPEAARNP